jgi:hypothetical protein
MTSTFLLGGPLDVWASFAKNANSDTPIFLAVWMQLR